MPRRLKDYNADVVDRFRRKMAANQRAEIRQNRYALWKISGKTDMFSESEHDGDGEPDYRTVRISDCGLTRLKDDDGMYAIGDADGRPITEFGFVYVSSKCIGDEDPLVEVITTSGKNRYYRISDGSVE